MTEKNFRDLFLGFIRVHILFHAAEHPVYGAELMEELSRHGYQIGPGTLYPILHRMEANGWLSSSRSTHEGKSRRYYEITKTGLAALDRAKNQARELINEILED